MNIEAFLKGDGIVGKVVVAIATAVLVGGSAPWWWNVFFGPSMSALQWETNLQGEDINNIDKADVNTAGACSDACLKSADCRSMTFVQHPPPKTGGICWLKNTVPPSKPASGMTSAVKRTVLW